MFRNTRQGGGWKDLAEVRRKLLPLFVGNALGTGNHIDPNSICFCITLDNKVLNINKGQAQGTVGRMHLTS
jgi:hypothetical protein